MSSTAGDAGRRVSPLGLAAAAFGLALFAWTIREAGLGLVADGIRRVGLGLLAILTLGGLRFLVRAWAWSLCADEGVLRVRDTFPALVMGDTLGNLTPLGLFVSEPAKAALVRRRVSLMTALASITLENLFYTLTVALVIAAGTVALVWAVGVAPALRQSAFIALLAMVLVVIAGALVLTQRLRILAPTLAWMERQNLLPAALGVRLDKITSLESQVVGFAARHPARVASILAIEMSFHVLGVVEVWVTLLLLVGPAAPTLLSTFLLEAVNRTITVLFKFVPLRLGVDEAGTEVVTRVLALPAGVGVTMAVVRKVRMLAWMALGVALLSARGVRR
jgi:hypothetical protein